MKIEDIHKEVFKFLLKKRETDSSLRYNLRFKNGEKMQNRYWFHGETDKNLYITFWDAWTDVFPTIMFVINVNGESKLQIDERRMEGQIDLWDNGLSSTLGLTKISTSDKKGITYAKSYSSNNYLENLNSFIQKERPFINSYLELKGRSEDYPPFPEGKFLRNLSKIESIRKGIKQTEFDIFLKQKATVSSLQLAHINAFESINLSFDKQVTCFIGGNGSGKTTLLRGIALGLVGSKGFAADELNLLAIRETRKVKRFHQKGVIDVSYTFNGQNFHNSVEFKSDKEQSEVYLVTDIGQSLRDETEDKRLQTLIVGFSQQTQSDKDTKINGGFNPKISDVEALIFNKVDNRYNEFIRWLKGLITADAKADRDYNKQIVDSVFEIINRITGDTIELTSETDTYIKTNKNPNGIPMDLLSQGYRNVLAWLGFFMKRMVEYQESLPIDVPNFKQLPAICLIDEIDTYLHPDWQYAILSGLVEHFPNVQFFITSHSPFVLTSVPSEKIAIFELNTEGGKITIKEKTENLYGADANRATESISVDRIPKYKEAFDKLMNRIDNNQLEEAKGILAGLINAKIDEHLDLDIIRAKRMIKTKELLNQNKSQK